jgi:hypothetical protein
MSALDQKRTFWQTCCGRGQTVLFCTVFTGTARILMLTRKAAFGYQQMSKGLPRQDAHSEKLLAVAAYWRKCAAQSGETWRSEMMRDTAEEFEKAAAKATRETV